MERVIKAHTPLGDDVLVFRSLRGEEGLSQLFEFQVELLSLSNALSMKALLGKPLTLEIETQPSMPPRYLNGQIIRCEIKGRDEGKERYYIYQATVRPWLWYATQTSDCKIFQNKSVPQILEDVLAEYGFEVEKRLTGQYATKEYCVQYQETDFNFCSRLMEQEGIYYFFEHELGSHTLILTDAVTEHNTLSVYPKIAYHEPDQVGQILDQYIDTWAAAEAVTSGGFATTDFDFKKAKVNLKTFRQNPPPHAHSDYEIYEWQGGYTEFQDGQHYARIRLEALQAGKERLEGHANVRGVAPGYLFTLTGHPRSSDNREYLIISAVYDFFENGYVTSDQNASHYTFTFTVQPSSVAYRSERTTQKVRTHGPQTAFVVGPKGEEIWTDQFGRVKVHFHWDRYDQKDENSSCWIRVSSAWAGNGFGAVQVPRIGDEVIVDFIGGDADCPIITGRVYNDTQTVPWKLPDNQTQSGLLSRSTKGGYSGTANALRFEDKKGKEELWLHAEKDQRIEVEHDESHWVGHDRSKTIDGNETTLVHKNRTETVDKDETITIHQHRKERVDLNETISVGQNRTEDVGQNETITIGENRVVTIGGNKAETVAIAKAETIGLAKALTIGAAYQVSVGAFMNTTVALAQAEEIGLSKTVIVGKSHSESVGTNKEVTVTQSHSETVGEDKTVNVTKTITVTAGDSIELICGKSVLRMDKDGHITLNGHEFALGTTGEQHYKADGNINMNGKKILEN